MVLLLGTGQGCTWYCFSVKVRDKLCIKILLDKFINGIAICTSQGCTMVLPPGTRSGMHMVFTPGTRTGKHMVFTSGKWSGLHMILPPGKGKACTWYLHLIRREGCTWYCHLIQVMDTHGIAT